MRYYLKIQAWGLALVALSVAALWLTGTAQAAPLTGPVTLVPINPPANLPLAQDEAAIEQQISTQYNVRWPDVNVQFSTVLTAGIQVYFWPAKAIEKACGPGALACHGDNPDGSYAIWVTDRISPQYEEIGLDHEILETLVDPQPGANPTNSPSGELEEICDPVEQYTYQSKMYPGIWLEPFVYPNYFKTDVVSHKTAFLPGNTVVLDLAKPLSF